MLMLPYLVEEVTDNGGQTMKGIGSSLRIPIMLCAPGRSIGRLKVQSRTENRQSFFFFSLQQFLNLTIVKFWVVSRNESAKK